MNPHPIEQKDSMVVEMIDVRKLEATTDWKKAWSSEAVEDKDFGLPLY